MVSKKILTKIFGSKKIIQKSFGQGQVERLFEISWEPNFPVNNLARNNGEIAPSSTQKSTQKDNHHILVDTLKLIKDWCVSPLPMTISNKFPVTGNEFPLTGNKFPMSGNKFTFT